ncbi:TetR/AcrR family transcriptional regulator [Glycomyces algeriensis]|uniref:TetR/AcrR family transcriptional regulator n=1 Tax=Glycomyces algeriensis TaxID=256037 RepID=UPI0022D2E8D4|nr:TetR/AcrR family transcriptional regulator [Glycomyces algeriensis]MDA1369047.1 TetR/AcrR family transcriptional regulator [Glycomyces algeriensis]MDR7352457.1 AcrR family transcriptional regulator [Glycomyces algeriensis]
MTSRRRGEELEQAILEAAFEEFRVAGYAGFTMEGVARRAGTSKPVVYRRWSSKVEILIACVASRLPEAETVPDTGSLRGDTVALVTLAHRRMRMIGQTAMLGMLADVSADPEARQILVSTLVSELTTLLEKAVWTRAVARGELEWGHLTERLRRLPIDLVRNEFIIYGAVPAETVESIVDEVVLPALRARGAAV